MRKDRIFYSQCKTVLHHSTLFRGLEDALLDKMLLMFQRVNWPRGNQHDSMFFQRRFCILIKGRIEVYRVNSETGRTVTLYILGPGDGIDIVTLMNNNPHDISAIAIDHTELVSVPVYHARNWIDKHPEFNRNFIPYLGEQLRTMEDLATDLALHDTMTRLARLILRHVNPDHPQSRDGGYHLKLIHNLSDDALARMVGSVRQVVNRHLTHWRKQGVIDRDRFKTVVKDLESLHEYSHSCLTKCDDSKAYSQY